MSPTVGSDVRAVCRRCGDVWHIVLALASGRIAKVECGDCGAQHRYRSPDGDKASSTRAPAKRRTASTARAAKPVVKANESRPRRPFAMTDVYEIGDRVVHPSFGEGVVQALIGVNKFEILFDVGSKTLVHRRKG